MYNIYATGRHLTNVTTFCTTYVEHIFPTVPVLCAFLFDLIETQNRPLAFIYKIIGDVKRNLKLNVWLHSFK